MRRRCATSTWKVLAMTSAATKHGKYAEAQQEDGGDAGFARAHAFDGFLDERGTGLHAEMLREQCADLFHGGCRTVSLASSISR